MVNNYIIYTFYKIYDLLLTMYIIIISKFSNYYNIINKKFCKPKNLVYIFHNKKLIAKENYDSFNKMLDLKKLLLEDNNNYFLIHKINYLDINFFSNNKLLNNNSLKKTNFTFILVEIINSKNKIDITNILNNNSNCYYLENNNLFDKNFIFWLQYNNLYIEENYKINIIDNNINSIELDKTKYIKLLSDSYDIIEIF